MKITLPYGKTSQTLTIDNAEDVEILERSSPDPKLPKEQPDEDEIVRKAMADPIDSPRLSELAAGKKTAVIICSDHTRPVPSKKIIPHMLKELREGNPDIRITLLIATGFHRLTTKEELVNKFGEEITETEKIIVHDSRDDNMLVKIGILPSGAELIINRAAAEADLLVSEGFIEPHFFAGFSGGRKSILPGICSQKTVLGNHCSSFIADEHCRTGILEGNPIHRDMEAAAKMARLEFIVNVIIDSEKKVIAAVAGDPVTAHREGCKELEKICTLRKKRAADIVVTTNGGAPLDQNIYQSVKGLTAAEAAAKDGAILIACSACSDGTGGEGFYRAIKECRDPADLLREIEKIPAAGTRPDQWEYQIMARILNRHRVILVCDPKTQQAAGEMKLETADTVQEAFEKALKEKPGGKITVIPDGVSVIIK